MAGMGDSGPMSGASDGAKRSVLNAAAKAGGRTRPTNNQLLCAPGPLPTHSMPAQQRTAPDWGLVPGVEKLRAGWRGCHPQWRPPCPIRHIRGLSTSLGEALAQSRSLSSVAAGAGTRLICAGTTTGKSPQFLALAVLIAWAPALRHTQMAC